LTGKREITKKKKNKNTGYFKKHCLPACHQIKTSGGTKQKPEKPHMQMCRLLQGSAPRIIPSEKNYSAAFPLYQFI